MKLIFDYKFRFYISKMNEICLELWWKCTSKLNSPKYYVCFYISLPGFLHIVINEISFFFQLKMRTVNFILIKNLCTVDLIGALVILPIPLVATARGRFDFGDTVCTANAVINVAIWFQHIVMFAMLKVNFSSGQRN